MYKNEKKSWLKHLDFLILDLIALQLSFVIAYIVRYGFYNPYELPLYRNIGFTMVLLMICIGFFSERYKNILRRSNFSEAKSVFSTVSITMVGSVLYVYLIRNATEFSRLVFIETALIGMVVLFIERSLWKKVLRRRYSGKVLHRSVVLIASKEGATEVMKAFKERRFRDFTVTGIVLLKPDRSLTDVRGVPIVSDVDHASEYLVKNIVDEVFIHLQSGEHYPVALATECADMGIAVHLNLGNLTVKSGRKMIEKMGNYIVLTTSVKIASPKQALAKRMMDIVGALIGLFITGIVTIFVAPIIFFQSPGSIFFSQERIGKNGRRFKIYKFRSMYLDAESRKSQLLAFNEMSGLMFKMKEDPRITPFGHFMRQYSIDELPQFFNVLMGDMSLVGTRPPTVEEFEKYEIHHKRRLSAKPGLTGIWQVSGRNDITNFEEIVDMDSTYIENWRLGLDVRILLQTILVVFRGKGAV